MSEPSVVMVCLYADRPAFIPRLLRSFRQQTYANKWLLIYDTGREPFEAELRPDEVLVRELADAPRPIGTLRNAAAAFSRMDIIAHADSDDWSHPNRLTEQVALLQSSGADLVGYNRMLYWQTAKCGTPQACSDCGEAWVYTGLHANYAHGTSLCYWRKTWERRPFPDLNIGEDLVWQTAQRVVSVDSLIAEPRMIAAIHAGNTAARIDPEKPANWRRAPEWDEYARREMRT